MSSDKALAIGLGVVGGILLLSALGDSKPKEIAPKPKPEPKQPKEKTPEQKEAEAIKNLLENNHFNEAVSRSCKLLFGLIRRKSAVNDKDSMKLIDHVFKPSNPVLKFTRHDDHPHLNTHEGYYFLLKGISAAFRNPVSHENIEMPQQEAVAQIVLIGHLYDLVERFTEKVEPRLQEVVG